MPGFPPALMHFPGSVDPFPYPDIAWYDPSDITSLFQDAAMTTPVTTPGQAVQAVEDITGNGNDIVWTSAGTSLTYEDDVDEGSRLEFNNQFLEKAGFTGLNGKQTVTIVNCWRIDSFSGGSATGFHMQDSSAIVQFAPVLTSSAAIRSVNVPTPASQSQSTSNTPLLGLFVVEILQYDGTQVAQADRMLITQNGKVQLNGTLANIASAVSADPIRFRMFGSAIGSNYAVGSWWGTMVYGRLLTADEKDIVQQYYYDKRMISNHYLPDPMDWYQFGATEGNASPAGGANPYSVTQPSDIEQGDFILRLRVLVSGSNESATNVPWTNIFSFSSGTTSLGLALFYREASAAEPASYTFTKSTGQVQATILARIRGGMVKNVSATNATYASSASTSATLTQSAPVLASEGILLFAVIFSDLNTVVTPPAGMTLVMDESVPTVPAATRMQVYAETLASGAAPGSRTITLALADTIQAGSVILA